MVNVTLDSDTSGHVHASGSNLNIDIFNNQTTFRNRK